MSEGTAKFIFRLRLSRWVVISLLLLIVTSLVAIADGRPGIALMGTVPLGIGLLLGNVIPKRRQFDLLSIVVAGPYSIVLAFVALYVWCAVELVISKDLNPWTARFPVEVLAGTLWALPAAVYGWPLAIVGAFVGHIFKKPDAIADPISN